MVLREPINTDKIALSALVHGSALHCPAKRAVCPLRIHTHLARAGGGSDRIDEDVALVPAIILACWVDGHDFVLLGQLGRSACRVHEGMGIARAFVARVEEVVDDATIPRGAETAVVDGGVAVGYVGREVCVVALGVPG